MKSIEFQVAGVRAKVDVINCKDDQLWGFYDQYPVSSGDLGLEIQCNVREGYLESRPNSPNYPAFQVIETSKNSVHLSRRDAAGKIYVGRTPAISGEFDVATNAHSLEAVVRVGMSVAMPYHHALIMHASAVSTEVGAYVFAGISGAGKSTLSAMLSEVDRVHKISDELLIVAKRKDQWNAFVTPFIGSKGLPHGRSDRIKGVFFLEQADEHRAIPLSTSQSLKEILRHVVVYASHPKTAQATMDRALELVAEVPCYRLRFKKNLGVRSVLGITCCSLSI